MFYSLRTVPTYFANLLKEWHKSNYVECFVFNSCNYVENIAKRTKYLNYTYYMYVYLKNLQMLLRNVPITNIFSLNKSKTKTLLLSSNII